MEGTAMDLKQQWQTVMSKLTGENVKWFDSELLKLERAPGLKGGLKNARAQVAQKRAA